MPGDVDWIALSEAALAARRTAYAPYSRFPVGAAGLTEDGRVLTGCNVENASYGLTLCAECGVVSALHVQGGGRLRAVCCFGPAAQPLLPCGRCRQLLWEHAGPGCLVLTPDGPVALAELLPSAFGPHDLERGRGPSSDEATEGPVARP